MAPTYEPIDLARDDRADSWFRRVHGLLPSAGDRVRSGEQWAMEGARPRCRQAEAAINDGKIVEAARAVLLTDLDAPTTAIAEQARRHEITAETAPPGDSEPGPSEVASPPPGIVHQLWRRVVRELETP